MAEFLFEIGFEEMPAPWLPKLADELGASFEKLATSAQLGPTHVGWAWTSRRLVVNASVKARQEDRSIVEWGPAATIAKDASGQWSKAAEGFARKHAVGVDGLVLAPKSQGSTDLYLSVTKHIPGRPAPGVLADLLPPLLRSLNFPKRMNWDAWLEDGRGAFEFGRPIQWIVALLDGEVVPLTIFDAVAGARGKTRLTSGRRSMGSRFYPRAASDRGFDVRSFAELTKGLGDRFVVLDARKRTDRINAQVAIAGGQNSGESAATMAEWVNLVEYPTVVIGSIPKDFADLPDEVLETVLAHHQKAVTLPRASDGTPRFAAISGCDDRGAMNAARGQERVVIARLKDARFFYNEDRKRPLGDRIADLANTLFHRGLGSYEVKARRMQNLAGLLARQAAFAETEVIGAARAALLAKADLGTLMVREFPELQGIVGGLYAVGTESPNVAEAIRWHYHPVAMERTALPAGRLSASGEAVFAIVSLSDKLDTLIGHFGLGVVPTGSSDPYGLRRAGQGVVRILLDFWPGENPPDLAKCVSGFFDWKPGVGDVASTEANKAATEKILREFLLDRLRGVLFARGDGAADEIEAVLSTRVDPLADVRKTAKRLDDLASVREEQKDVFAALAESFKRAKNIVGDGSSAAVDEGLFTESAERKLYASIQTAEKTPSSDPAARLRAVAGLRNDVDAFFKGVMVNAEEPMIRANRHAILRRLLDLVYEVADLSKLASPSGDSATSS